MKSKEELIVGGFFIGVGAISGGILLGSLLGGPLGAVVGAALAIGAMTDAGTGRRQNRHHPSTRDYHSSLDSFSSKNQQDDNSVFNSIVLPIPSKKHEDPLEKFRNDPAASFLFGEEQNNNTRNRSERPRRHIQTITSLYQSLYEDDRPEHIYEPIITRRQNYHTPHTNRNNHPINGRGTMRNEAYFRRQERR